MLRRAAGIAGICPLFTRASLEEARTLRQNQLVKQIPLFLAPIAYDNLHIACMREDGELILRLQSGPAELRPMLTMSPHSRGARGV